MKLVWYRNDLRTGDHRALYHACQTSQGEGVLAVAAVTPNQWLLQDEAKCRVQFWLATLAKLCDELNTLNIPLLIVRVPSNLELPKQLLELAYKHRVTELCFNSEFAEYECQRDSAVEKAFSKAHIKVSRFNSDLVITPDSIANQQGQPYKVFTPFSKIWRQRFIELNPQPLPKPDKQVETGIQPSDVPANIGYQNQMGADWNRLLWPPGTDAAHEKLRDFISAHFSVYADKRDFPALPGTSSLSPYLANGTMSTLQCIAAAQVYSDDREWFTNQWVTELIWREFYRHLLSHYPEMNRWHPFKPEVEEKLIWRYDENLFSAWCAGETGFDIVDAGMKQLVETGWMHNRVRMITASFLTKLLRQDWRLGARFFMRHLLDGDFASNLGGWQWSASVGADAAPYFRIFSPQRQTERFDPKCDYIQHWLPPLRPAPIIDYSVERKRSIDSYNS